MFEGMGINELACVFKLVNCYAAIHIQKDKSVCISEHPETDIKVAQTTAELFAKQHNIPYSNELLRMRNPIITIINNGEGWFPAELHSEKIRLLTGLGSFKFQEFNQNQAANLAEVIALSQNADFIPSIGISLGVRKDLKK